jgi:hypothetical protein
MRHVLTGTWTVSTTVRVTSSVTEISIAFIDQPRVNVVQAIANPPAAKLPQRSDLVALSSSWRRACRSAVQPPK